MIFPITSKKIFHSWDSMTDLKGRVWAFVLYPESCIDYLDMIKYLERLCIPMAISPLHNPEKNNDNDENEEKKIHFHILMYFDGQKQQKDLKKLLDYGVTRYDQKYFNWSLLCDKKNITGKKAVYPYFLKVNSLSSYFRYLIHLDQPLKQQFKGYKISHFVVDDEQKYNHIVLLNGFNEKDYLTRCTIEPDEQLLKIVEEMEIKKISELIYYLTKTKNKLLTGYIKKNMVWVSRYLLPDLFEHFGKSATTTKADIEH